MTSFDTHTIVVEQLDVQRLWVPLRRPLATRVGVFEAGPFLGLKLRVRGGGEAHLLGFTFSRLGLTVVPPALDMLARFAKGRLLTLAELPSFHDACQKHLTLLGHEGVVQMALSMFDMLLYDALAREAGIPLYRLLGGTAKAVPTYNSCGLGLLDPTAVAREARELADAHGGYSHVKMRLGRASIADDVTALQAVRSALGPEIALSVDFNQGLESASALEACRAIDDLGLAWIEEPVIYDDYATQARLARKLATPLQVGENWWSWRVGSQAITDGVCDCVMPDILRIGGVTGWLRLAAAAHVHAVPFSSHLSPDYSVHVMTATPTAHWLEYMDWGQDLIEEPLVPTKGFAAPPERPGSGIVLRERDLARYIVPA
ncbi:MAG: enolase C-terminal domain-like protein [Hyphomicrobiaceae bacterium]